METVASLQGEGTIIPSLLDTSERQAMTTVGALSPGSATELKVGEVIGEGGMGVVRVAEQLALGRTVAVKTLKAGHTNPTSVRDLLREAWITGSLEHPSVVPVHFLDVRDGIPVLVLKRIEGTAWNLLITDRDAVEARFGATDLLTWNLGILVQVLNAVGFAHSRGILHRDLKPANVMIGDFGEVYLLDWGIAVSLRDDGTGRLPLASRVHEIAGTPGYMAPEMLARDGDVLTVRTDVYLAGAVLFEMIAGHPPHRGCDALSILTSIIAEEPELPASAPPELARICKRALDRDPERRYETIDALRLALHSYLEHRGSSQLAERARADLVRLRESIASSPREELYQLFGACRFGFHEALAVWRDNDEARAGLVDATVTLAEFELEHDNPNAALALLADITAPPEILARSRLAADVQARRKAELERLLHDADLSVHRRGRLVYAAGLAFVFSILPLVNAFLPGAKLADQRQMFLFSVGVTALVAAFSWWVRDTLGCTSVNRRVLASAGLLFCGQSLLWLGAWALELPTEKIQALMIALWATLGAVFTIHIDRRIAPAAVGYIVAFLVVLRWQDLRPYVVSAANLLVTFNLVWIWRERKSDSSVASH